MDVEKKEGTSAPVDGAGKNATSIICPHCECLILLPGNGSLVEENHILPARAAGEEGTEFGGWWKIEDMFHFENIAFSKVVGDDDCQFLACAECEREPIGFSKEGFFLCADAGKISYKGK
jgi:hypothetical protein